jgi:hypothetical protein
VIANVSLVVANVSTVLKPIDIGGCIALTTDSWKDFEYDKTVTPPPNSFAFETAKLDAGPVVYLSNVIGTRRGKQSEPEFESERVCDLQTAPSEFKFTHPFPRLPTDVRSLYCPKSCSGSRHCQFDTSATICDLFYAEHTNFHDDFHDRCVLT